MTTAGDWVPLRSFVVCAKAEVQDLPLVPHAGQLGPHDVAYARLPNIFGINTTAGYVVLNILGRGGRMLRASLLFPSSGGDVAQVHHMKFDDR